MAAAKALLIAAGLLKQNKKLLKKSSATEHATSSSSTATKACLSTGASREAPVDKRAHQDTNSSYSRIARRQPTCQELMFQVCCSRHAKGKRQDYSITTIQKHHIRATRQKHHSKSITENNTTSNRKDKRTTAERKYKSTTAWETLVGSSTKAACAAVTLGSRHTPLHEHGVSPDEEKRLECARCYRARAARCWSM